MIPPRRVLVGRLLPGLSGRGVVLASPVDRGIIARTLADHGFTLVEVAPPRPVDDVDTLDADPPSTSLREAQAAIAAALRLPAAAGRNLDALVDSLRDLAVWWPDHERVALLWPGAEALVESDLPGWHTLTEILRGASDDLWRGGGTRGDRVFEVVAFVDRHGVTVLPAQECR